jgi:opacity protein-like surface antigen
MLGVCIMKKFMLVFSVLMLFSSVALASPLMDYSAGKGSIDWMFFRPQMTVTQDGNKGDFPYKQTDFDGTITAGIGHNFALQYRYYHPKFSFDSDLEELGHVTNSLKFDEYNVLYNINKNVSVYAGITSNEVKTRFTDGFYSPWKTGNKWQVGLVTTTEIGPKTNFWGNFALGKDLSNWEVGISYEIAKNVELNVAYRDLQRKNYKEHIREWEPKCDLEAKGFSYGVTYKF